jgi:aspartyl-tRNA(Asn)/glutamyl-tRNA(Gln) amidotransferase subunit C
MTQLTKEDVKHVASLARIEVSDEEAALFAEQLSDTLNFTSVLDELDTDNVVPMTHPLQLMNVLRKDVPTDILDREEMLKSVKEHEAGQIKVPTIL